MLTTRATWQAALIAVVVGLTAIVLVVDAAVSLASGAYLNLGSGVWLALAHDLRDGVFYRPLWDEAVYGGTRYFPVLFTLVAVLTKAAVPEVAAGLSVSVAGLLALIVAVALFLTRLSVPSPLVALGSALAVAPYFVHETAFAIRCEPLAAAFAVAGLAVLSPVEEQGHSTKRQALAATLFACAFATKLTCVYAAVAAIVALFIAGRSAIALRLAALTAAGAAVFLIALHVLSDGRAIESFRACALAGSTVGSLLVHAFSTRPLMLVATSHLLTGLFLLVAAAAVASPRQWRRLPALYLVSAAMVTAVVLASPGTILGSQIVEVYVAAIVFLAAVTAAAGGRLRAAGVAVMIGLAIWAAGQNIARITTMLRRDALRVSAEERLALIAAVEQCGGSVLAESPLVPLVAGYRPVILDPFAFHVLTLNRPEIGRDLAARVSRREFGCVVIEQDPATSRGRAWYRNVNLTEPVIDAVMEHYAYDRSIGAQRVYRRRSGP